MAATSEKAFMDSPAETHPPDEQAWSGGWPQTREQFEPFIAAFQDRLIRYAWRRLADFHEAEDAVQEVFVRAYTNRKKLEPVDHVASYLYRMTANECTDRLRRRRHKIVPIEMINAEELADAQEAASERLAAEDELKRIDQYLSALPSRQAEVIRLRVLDELSLADAARVLGRPLPTIKSRLRHGLKKLRRLIRSEKVAK